ncbi:protein translocase subunit SecF [Soehngenia saccharolytica]|nr:protein translocase subunit SecF [Soehngenia saccharolytica]
MDVLKYKKIAYSISIAIILVGIGMFFTRGFNLGIDFTGGTIITLNLNQYTSTEDVKQTINKYDENASIIHEGENKDTIIIKSNKDLSNNDINSLINDFRSQYGLSDNSYQTEKFGPSMGSEIFKRAIISILVAIICMLIYISIRFQFNFGVAAIIALIHDCLIMTSLYLILNIPVNSAFIAAILTILGYSINDTIVIFDRIREELHLNKKMKLDALVNKSIKATLRRTLYTTLTTLVAVLSLYIFGVDAVKELALPLIFGMIAGTYSTLFIASPIWYKMEVKARSN